jgi:hypothetical protein
MQPVIERDDGGAAIVRDEEFAPGEWFCRLFGNSKSDVISHSLHAAPHTFYRDRL